MDTDLENSSSEHTERIGQVPGTLNESIVSTLSAEQEKMAAPEMSTSQNAKLREAGKAFKLVMANRQASIPRVKRRWKWVQRT
jgi:hypothetical protein